MTISLALAGHTEHGANLSLMCLVDATFCAGNLQTVSTPAVQGVRHVVENDAWKYCAVVPASHSSQGLQSGRAFGVGPDTDATDNYDISFVPSDKAYKVLSICIYEVSKYFYKQKLA